MQPRAAGRVAVRVDANPEIGLGHLRRCVTLSRQLRSDGFEVRLLSRRFAPDLLRFVGDLPVAWLEDDGSADEAKDADSTLTIVGENPAGVSWVTVDHYGLGEAWENSVRSSGHKILAIDDFRDRRHAADILVSDSDAPFGPALNAAAGARELTGARFALVDPEFAFADAAPTAGKKRLLVSYGGSDPTDETTKALEAVRLLRKDGPSGDWLGEVAAVVGPANARAEEIARLAAAIPGVTVHAAPSSLAPLLRQADLFLTAGGNSMVEALTMRKPCLVTVTSANQALLTGQLRERGVVVSLGDHATIDPARLADALRRASSDYARFLAAVKADPVFDHLGAGRISAAMRSPS